MDVGQVAALGAALRLGEDSLLLLQQQRVTGAHLLAMREGALLERLGVRPVDALALLQAVERARSGGPKTVRLAPSEAAPAVAALWQTFEAQQELAEFLARVGAAGLRRGGSQVLTSRLKQVRARREGCEAACHLGTLRSLRSPVPLSPPLDHTGAHPSLNSPPRSSLRASCTRLSFWAQGALRQTWR
jgi:hypothetical protein